MKFEGGGLSLVLKFCLVLGSDHNHNRWKREGEEYVFPVPKIENVYQAWKPIDYGHPLVDPTMHYIPPELETVHIGPQEPEQFDPFGEGAVTDQFLKAKIYLSPETGRSNEDGIHNPDRVHVYKAHSSHRVVKAEPGNIIPDHTKASPRIDIEDYREASAPQPLKSGIYYVDDPFEEFRPKKRRRDPTADRFRFPGDKGFGRRVDIEREEKRNDDNSEGMYIPVSLLSTPPTIETTDRSYGDIVNEDFYQFELKNKNPQVYPVGPELPPVPAQGSVFPLGNPYGVPNYRRTPNRGLQGVFGPRIPEVSDHPAPRLDTRQGEPNVWTPQPASYVAKDREFSGQPTINRQSGVRSSYPQGEGRNLEARPQATNPQYHRREFQENRETPFTSSGASDVPQEDVQGPQDIGYQLIYSQSRGLDKSESGCPHGLPSFLRSICNPSSQQKQRMDRSSFSEHVDPNMQNILMKEMAPNPKFHHAISRRLQNLAPDQIARFSNLPLDSADDGASGPAPTHYNFVQDTQYFTESEDENVPDESSLVPTLARSIDVPDLKERSIDVPGLEEETNSFPENVLTADSQIPFDFVESTPVRSGEIQYSVAGGNVAVYKPEITTATTTTTTTSTTTPRPSTTTEKPAIPFQYQTPIPGYDPPKPRQRRPLVYAKRQQGGQPSISQPFEYISKLSSILSDRVFNVGSTRPPQGVSSPHRQQLKRQRVQQRNFPFF